MKIMQTSDGEIAKGSGSETSKGTVTGTLSVF